MRGNGRLIPRALNKFTFEQLSRMRIPGEDRQNDEAPWNYFLVTSFSTGTAIITSIIEYPQGTRHAFDICYVIETSQKSMRQVAPLSILQMKKKFSKDRV